MSIEMEFAVQLPDGTLLQEMQHQHGGIFGRCIERPVGARIFRTRAEAEHAVSELRKAATTVGVRDLLAVVVHRHCSPWLGGDVTEQLAQQFLDYIESDTTP